MLNDSKRLVYAYDELQSLSGESLPPPGEIFENNNEVSNSDIILEKCYRNSRPVLVAAHSLGFGVYREPEREGDIGLIQMFDYPRLWEEIGYRQKSDALKEGAPVCLYRPEDTSPKFLEDHSDIEDLIKFLSFESEEEQAEWVAQAIENNLLNDELRYDDIVVINPDPRTTKSKVGSGRRLLFERNINSHLAGVDTDPDIFYNEESITFTGVFRAKGNEAGMVYIIRGLYTILHDGRPHRSRGALGEEGLADASANPPTASFAGAMRPPSRASRASCTSTPWAAAR